jgi:hypothetical protein
MAYERSKVEKELMVRPNLHTSVVCVSNKTLLVPESKMIEREVCRVEVVLPLTKIFGEVNTH